MTYFACKRNFWHLKEQCKTKIQIDNMESEEYETRFHMQGVASTAKQNNARGEAETLFVLLHNDSARTE